MNEQQLSQLVQEVAAYLQQGSSPEDVAQALVQQGVPKEAVQQVIQIAMQSLHGGQNNPQGEESAQGGGSILEQLAAEDPESLMMIIQEWESLSPEERNRSCLLLMVVRNRLLNNLSSLRVLECFNANLTVIMP